MGASKVRFIAGTGLPGLRPPMSAFQPPSPLSMTNDPTCKYSAAILRRTDLLLLQGEYCGVPLGGPRDVEVEGDLELA